MSLFGFVAQAGAQDNALTERSGLPGLMEKTGSADKSGTADAASGYTYSAVHNFCSAANCTDGSLPSGALIQDGAGNLYGTTDLGGVSLWTGTVFELDTTGKESVLYNFCSAANCTDGENPSGGLIMDKTTGNLYGATGQGGESSKSTWCVGSCGTVFELFPEPSGGCSSGSHAGNSWCETVLYSFCSASSASNCTDGYSPQSLIQDSAGNLYGTTPVGGEYSNSSCPTGCGTVFELFPEPSRGCPSGSNTGNGWCETVLYSFCSIGEYCTDGASPIGGLIRDDAGNFYGTTRLAGAGYGGTVFELFPEPSGGCAGGTNTGNGWCETVVYSFCTNCADGSNPAGGLIQDATGNLYGATEFGGANNGGVVFKLDTTHHESVIYNFCSATNCTDGRYPYGALIQDKSTGNLYSTTSAGGRNSTSTFCSSDCGTVFELLPEPSGGCPSGSNTGNSWCENVIYSFCSAANCTDGDQPLAGLIQDSAGSLYGTTYEGGEYSNSTWCSSGCGTVFKLATSGGAGSGITTFDAPCAGGGTYADSINTAGTIAGYSKDSNGVLHGFVRSTSGTITCFEAPDAGTETKQGTKAYAINTAGAIAGSYHDSNGVWHGFERAATSPFTITEFSAQGAGTSDGLGTFAFGINTAGVISGLYTAMNSANGFERAAKSPFPITEFNVPGAVGTAAIGINTAGELAGYYVDASNVYHGFVRAANDTITTFDAPGAGTGPGQGTGGDSENTLNFDISINTAGTIAGYYVDASNAYHGFVRAANGTMTAPIDAPGAGTGQLQGTIPGGINAAGTITGYSIDADNVAHGFVRTATGTVTDFDAPGAGTAAGQGTFALGINTAGAITGHYIDTNSVAHGFVLAPLTATSTTLKSSPNPSTSGEAVTFTAVVTSKAGTPPNDETVSFMAGKTVLGTGTLNDGSATFTTSTLKVGTTSVTAVYGGDSEFKGSTSKAVKQVVQK